MDLATRHWFDISMKPKLVHVQSVAIGFTGSAMRSAKLSVKITFPGIWVVAGSSTQQKSKALEMVSWKHVSTLRISIPMSSSVLFQRTVPGRETALNWFSQSISSHQCCPISATGASTAFPLLDSPMQQSISTVQPLNPAIVTVNRRMRPVLCNAGVVIRDGQLQSSHTRNATKAFLLRRKIWRRWSEFAEKTAMQLLLVPWSMKVFGSFRISLLVR